MCVIAVSPSGVPQPSFSDLCSMWIHNPHGAGYMVARTGKVFIHKGFMSWKDFRSALELESFTAADPVVYHFRISTQAGVIPQMTHPFPLSADLSKHEALDLVCPVGIAHNGIIQLTSDRLEKRYSDTSLFIAQYLTKLIRSKKDIHDRTIHQIIALIARSKFAIMDGDGKIETIGDFISDHGILLSNTNHMYSQWAFDISPEKLQGAL